MDFQSMTPSGCGTQEMFTEIEKNIEKKSDVLYE